MSLSIIIPTFNRSEILQKCLQALSLQSIFKAKFEVIVVDDGSNDDTPKVVKHWVKDGSLKIRYFRQNNRGPAAARNLGIRKAWGEIVLLIGDDIIAAPTLLEKHLNYHLNYPASNAAVLGLVTWSPEIKVTPFMRWLEESRYQFAYKEVEEEMKKKGEISYLYLYTSNVSLKKSFIIEKNIFFDEDFPYAAFEDFEWGYRLARHGLKLFYLKGAVGYHNHPTSFEEACRRMGKVGRSARILSQKHPELKSVLSIGKKKAILPIKLLLSALYSSIVFFLPITGLLKRIYKYKMDDAFLKGYVDEERRLK